MKLNFKILKLEHTFLYTYSPFISSSKLRQFRKQEFVRQDYCTVMYEHVSKNSRIRKTVLSSDYKGIKIKSWAKVISVHLIFTD